MTDNLLRRPHGFKIVSISEGKRPIGVNFTVPATQNVQIDAPVQRWVFHKVADNKYRLSIGGYSYTGGAPAGKVTASVHPENEVEWEITYQEFHDAYTIALAKEPHFGWTVPDALADSDVIEIRAIRSTMSIPPQFSPSQLFWLKKDD